MHVIKGVVNNCNVLTVIQVYTSLCGRCHKTIVFNYHIFATVQNNKVPIVACEFQSLYYKIAFPYVLYRGGFNVRTGIPGTLSIRRMNGKAYEQYIQYDE